MKKFKFIKSSSMLDRLFRESQSTSGTCNPASDRIFAICISKEEVDAGSVEPILKSVQLLKELSKRKRPDLFFHGYDHDSRDVWEIPEIRMFVKTILLAIPEYPSYFSEEGRGILRHCSGTIKGYKGTGLARYADVEPSDLWLNAAKVCGLAPFEPAKVTLQ